MKLLLLSGRVVVAAGGLLFCYGALFLYETERRQVQSRLEELWIRVDDLQKQAVQRHTAFLRVSAVAASRFLDRLFGESSLSLRFFAVTACLSVASIILVSKLGLLVLLPLLRSGQLSAVRFPYFLDLLVGRLLLATMSSGPVLGTDNLPFAFFFLAVAAAAVIAQFLWRRLSALPIAVVVAFVAIIFIAAPRGQNLRPYLVATTAILLGVACDAVAVVVIRACLRRQGATHSTALIAAIAVAEIAIGAGLIVGPLMSPNLFDTRSVNGVSMAIGSAIAFTSNGASVALTFTFIFAALTLAIHRLVWPIVARPLYLMADLHLFASRKTRAAVLALGVALVAIASGKAGALVSALQALFSAA